jgi:hypothetical protein
MYPCCYWWLGPGVNIEPDRSYIVLSFTQNEGRLLPSTIAVELTDDQQEKLRQTEPKRLLWIKLCYPTIREMSGVRIPIR